MHKITIKNLTKIYGNNPKQALELLHKGLSNEEIRRRTRQVVGVKQVDFSVAAGESFVIMGLSGSGKSTLLRCLNRLIEASSGEIIIDGENITELPIKELTQLRRKKIAMVFQHFALLPHRTILDNVAYGLEVDKVPKPQRNARALEILELVGLKEWADYHPDNLSGGMQQRVGIARALTTDPDILLMDEPFSALDPLIRQEMQDELMVLQRKLQKTIVFITHDLDEALKIGDRVALMKDGEIVQIGSPEDILLSPATDYVARFVENVDRAKALMATSVMVKARSIVYPKDGPLVALRTMEKYGMSTLFVTDRGGKIIGYIRAEDAAEEANKGERQLDAIIQHDMPLTAPETPLRDLLEVIAHTKVPVAVVNEKKILVGVLVRGSVIAGLAGEGRELA